MNDRTPAVKFHINDHLESNLVLLDEKGNLIDREEYTPFGETSFGSLAKKRYRFSGKERDWESSLYYYGARYFAPQFGRFISPERDAWQNKNLPVLNGYMYASNNPIRYGDPTGMWEVDMHFSMVYITGRFAGADHKTALKGSSE